jgi:hypothetical protein
MSFSSRLIFWYVICHNFTASTDDFCDQGLIQLQV